MTIYKDDFGALYCDGANDDCDRRDDERRAPATHALLYDEGGPVANYVCADCASYYEDATPLSDLVGQAPDHMPLSQARVNFIRASDETPTQPTYTTMTCSIGWYDAYALTAIHDYCGVRHKRLRAAVACDAKKARAVSRATGGNTWIDTRIIAWDGDRPRRLTDREADLAEDMRYDMQPA